MKRKNKIDMLILRVLFVFGLGILPSIVLRKPPLKDWLLVYLWNAVTNAIIDRFLTYFNTLEYPVRLYPKVFKTNILFDLLLYPIVTIVYNQRTAKDKPVMIFIKLFLFTIPMTFIEIWAERKTNLIKFGGRWKWYHSFISLTIKSLATRVWIGAIRKLIEKKKQKNAYKILTG